MECADIKRYLDEYIDNECPALQDAITEHLQQCPQCRREYEERKVLSEYMSTLELEELPFYFESVLNENMAEKKQKTNSSRPLHKRVWFKVTAACACLMLCVGLFGAVGFGSFFAAGSDSAASDSNFANTGSNDFVSDSITNAPMELFDEMEYSTGDSAMPEDDKLSVDLQNGASETGNASGNSVESYERKVIKDWNITLRVDDFDLAMDEIEAIAGTYGGYVVSGSVYGGSDNGYKDGEISIRVDAKRADQAVDAIGELGKVDESNYSTADVTMEYYDIKGRLENYQAQAVRLQDMYEQAYSIDELIMLESELSRVQSEIDSLQGRIKYYDQLTDLSLIAVFLYMPGTYTQTVEPEGWAGFWGKISESFFSGVNNMLDFFADLFVWLIGVLPALVVIAVIVVAVVLLIKRRRKNRK